MKYCPECGCELKPEGFQGRGEFIRCQNGHFITPPSPKILVASFVNCGPRLLWMRRARAPQRGFWAIPAGFMENGETLREAAARELREETCVDIPPERFAPYMIGSINFISEVYIGFRATVNDDDCGCGTEALDVGFFAEDELEWEQVAYPSANDAVRTAYREARDNRFGVYHGLYTADAQLLEEVIPANAL